MFGIGRKKEETQATSCCCNQPDQGNAQCGCNMADQADCGCAANVGNTVKILGSGCKNCHALLENTQAAVKAMGKSDSFRIEYITDMPTVMGYGVMSMPALVLNEKVVSMGKVLKPAEVQRILENSGC